VACTNCGNEWCTGCTSSLSHVAGDPWDPADSKYDRDLPRALAPEAIVRKPTPVEHAEEPCPHCGAGVTVTGRRIEQGMISSELYTEMVDLACSGCGAAWSEEDRA